MLATLWWISSAAFSQTGPPAGASAVPSAPEEFKIYTEHPRLLLPARRLRLIRREKERQTMRWEQFMTLMAGKADMPEKGFANALAYITTQEAPYGKEAVKWALGPANDVRQLALVFDWCQEAMSDGEKKLLAGKLQKALSAPKPNPTVAEMRNRVLAAVTLFDHVPELPEKTLRSFFTEWWMGQVVPSLLKNRLALANADAYPLLEIFHVIRDNLNFDMRDNALVYFKDFPVHRVLSYYPATFPAADAMYRIPQYPGTGEPDIPGAAMARAADLAIVAFDANALEHQFLQGWLIQDRFLLKGPLGAPYEFLWANPYQPGLSYHHLPRFYHDPRTGVLLMRSSWEEDAIWLSYAKGEIELFMDGRRSGLKPAALTEPLEIGDHLVMLGAPTMNLTLNLPGNTRYFVLGMKPNSYYEIEVDDEELREEKSDAGGILVLSFPASSNVGVRLKESAFQR